MEGRYPAQAVPQAARPQSPPHHASPGAGATTASSSPSDEPPWTTFPPTPEDYSQQDGTLDLNFRGSFKLNVEAAVSDAAYRELQARGHDGNRIAAGDPRRDCYAMAS